ncbi:MAG: hypothetical protein FWB99_02265 [Treponema sp.]|nr:hypothetical protein [Treponema sp.]
MESMQKLSSLTTELMNQAQNLQRIAGELSKLIGEHNVNCLEKEVLTESLSNIISFPLRVSHGAPVNPRPKNPRKAGGNERRFTELRFPAALIPAAPGKPLPDGLTDYRPLLQRDGLLLLSWDKRLTEMGERYTAYWVTSSGISRFYASRSLALEEFPSARPDHKSYAAEDGIEFYGQEAPAYVAHVAPELMMNNPRHGELRLAHIQMLKEQGSTVDFNYKYLLKTEKEKNRHTSYKKTKNIDQAG